MLTSSSEDGGEPSTTTGFFGVAVQLSWLFWEVDEEDVEDAEEDEDSSEEEEGSGEASAFLFPMLTRCNEG